MDNTKPEEFNIFRERDGNNGDVMRMYGLNDDRIIFEENESEASVSKKPKKPPTTGTKPPTSEPTEGADKETVKKMTGIESAKDRAQITSSTAMSIVHVALLKNVLDFGSENDKYYNYRIGFILTALILQVIAGFLALYIALLRGYYTKYRDDFLNDCFKMCCPWRCRKTKRVHSKQTTTTATTDGECEDRVGCCPYECATQSYYHFEDEILDMYDVVTEKAVRSEIEAASANTDIAWFTAKSESLNKKLEKYKNAEDAEDNAESVANINKGIKEALKKKEELEIKKQFAETCLAKGLAMEKHVEKIYQQRVLKRVTFWQNLLNMIFYVVFILNAVIAGLGLADPNAVAATAGDTTETVSPQTS